MNTLIHSDLNSYYMDLWFLTHFDVEEPGFEGVHLTGSLAEVVYNQVESSGSQEVRVRAAELLSTCGVKTQGVKLSAG